MARPGYFIRPQVSDSRPKRSIGSRLGEAAARAAIGTGIGLVGQTGSKMLGNLFAKGGAAELAMTPEETLAQRAAKQDADMRLAAATTGAQRATAGLRQMQAARVPSEIEAKMAQAGKARMSTKLAPIKEERKQREFEFDKANRQLDRSHDGYMENLRQANRLQLEAKRQDGRVDIETLKSRLKKSGTGRIRLADGRVMTRKQANAVLLNYNKLANLAVDNGDMATANSIGDELLELTAALSGGVPLPLAFDLTEGETEMKPGDQVRLAGEFLEAMNFPSAEAKREANKIGRTILNNLNQDLQAGSSGSGSGSLSQKRRALSNRADAINANPNLTKEQKIKEIKKAAKEVEASYPGPPLGLRF